MACLSQTYLGASLDCGNSGGIQAIYISSVLNVTVGVPSGSTISGITMQTGKFAKFSTRRGNSDMKITADGDDKAGTKQVTTEVTAQFNHMSPELRLELQKLLNDNVYVIVLDENGKYHFIGYGSYAMVTGGGGTGADMNSANMYNVSIKAITKEVPYFLDATAVSSAI